MPRIRRVRNQPQPRPRPSSSPSSVNTPAPMARCRLRASWSWRCITRRSVITPRSRRRIGTRPGRRFLHVECARARVRRTGRGSMRRFARSSIGRRLRLCRDWNRAGEHGDARDRRCAGIVCAGNTSGGPPVRRCLEHPLGQSLAIPSQAIVFSNELFDAQPCHRLIHHAAAGAKSVFPSGPGHWRKPCSGTLPGSASRAGSPAFGRAGRLPDRSAPGRGPPRRQPLAAPPWSGLFVAVDYGKSWRELAEETPSGHRARLFPPPAKQRPARPARRTGSDPATSAGTGSVKP